MNWDIKMYLIAPDTLWISQPSPCYRQGRTINQEEVNEDIYKNFTGIFFWQRKKSDSPNSHCVWNPLIRNYDKITWTGRSSKGKISLLHCIVATENLQPLCAQTLWKWGYILLEGITYFQSIAIVLTSNPRFKAHFPPLLTALL